jgi:hypothetical protein
LNQPETKGERVHEFIERLGVCHMTFLRRLKHRRCPFVDMDKGPSGRVLSIHQPSKRFEEFVKTGL